MSESLRQRVQWAIDSSAETPNLAETLDPGIPANLAEDAPLYYPPFDGLPEPEPGEIYVEQGQFPELLELLRVLDIDPTNSKRVPRTISHENDHAEILLGFGAEQVLQGVQLRSLGLDSTGEHKTAVSCYFTAAGGLVLPLLGLVATHLYPLHSRKRDNGGPSGGDLRVVTGLGFPGGVEANAKRIEAWNQAGKEPYIPLPRTYQLSA
ncbi:MAG TPA: hypothetical protein VLF91_04315 [Candidatus Saccharimonadales bacterium]|nr:hypothetical protein [Candidatus Saccharimonadales bacterium]